MVTSSQKSKQALPSGEGKKVAVVVSRFNEGICEKLLQGAKEALSVCGVADDDVDIYRIPGAFELPLALQAVANREEYDAAIALGVVIRGETSHYDFVAGEASRGIQEVILKTGLPTGFGLLTTDNVEQAEARAGGAHGNKGYDAAVVALEMAAMLDSVEKRS